LQLFVAAGGNLSTIPALDNVTQHGASIECRLTAESPQNNFLPEHGKVHLWLPAPGVLSPGRDVRYETAIQSGSVVSIYFDSMIAKLVVWAPTRSLAIEKMQQVLAHTACVGVRTNQLFLQACLSNKEFHDPAYTTSFIPNNLEQLLQPSFLPKATDIEPVLSIMSSLAVRYLPDHVPKSLQTKPFHYVRRQFRNQRLDPVNVHCDVITAVDWPYHNKSKEPIPSSLCIWKAPSPESPTAMAEAFVLSIPDEKNFENDSQSAATEISMKYNQISQEIRSGKYVSSAPYKARIEAWQPAEGSAAIIESWLSSRITVSISGVKTSAYICLPSVRPHSFTGQVDQSQQIFFHIPAIGTYVEMKRDTLLSFAGSIRSIAKSKDDPAQKTVTAPMPCKVLSILKSNGDSVKAGDSVMIIESMKMEITISAASTGNFETKWKEGDAVEDGKVLCTVV
jgi:acetyl/propionyl-CoA carboxylase alpha subunit